MQRLQITTLAAQDISAPLLAATYTADADRELLIQVYLSGLAGNGAYRACMTKQLLGVGIVHQSPTSAASLGAITTLFLQGLPIPVQDTDVVRVYVQGLAADVAVATNVEVFDVTTDCGLGADGPVRTYTVTNSLTGLPEAGVYVRVTTDVAGLNTIRAGYTDVFGNFYPRLIAGTYYFWCTKQGFGEVQADMEVFV
jgi:hypothetical protein